MCEEAGAGCSFLAPTPPYFNAEHNEQLRVGSPSFPALCAGERDARLNIGAGVRQAITCQGGHDSCIDGELGAMPQRQAVAHCLNAPRITAGNINIHVSDADVAGDAGPSLTTYTRANARSKGSARVGSTPDVAQAARWSPSASRLRRQLQVRSPSGKGRRKRRRRRTRCSWRRRQWEVRSRGCPIAPAFGASVLRPSQRTSALHAVINTWVSRWSGLLAVAAQRAYAASLLKLYPPAAELSDSIEPNLHEAMLDWMNFWSPSTLAVPRKQGGPSGGEGSHGCKPQGTARDSTGNARASAQQNGTPD
eukprot:s144_g7.t1